MNIPQTFTQKFELGQVLITPGAYEELNLRDVASSLIRHASGDFGVVSEEDWALNEEAVENEGRILSAYRDRLDVKYWIITEWDRSATTILLPSEY